MFIEDHIKLVQNDKNEIKSVIRGSSVQRTVTGISYDSRRMEEGSIFFCKGRNFKTEYVRHACERGACAVFYESDIDVSDCVRDFPECDFVCVADVRRAMALCSALHFGYPMKRLTTVAVTGTKGKTSTVRMIKNVLSETRGFCAEILGDNVSESAPRLTTPEAPDLHEAAYRALKNGATHLVCEISSQAMSEKRCYGIEFDIACFLNLGRDHISPCEHRSEEEYFRAKASLFLQCGHAVLNADDESSALISVLMKDKRPSAPITYFSFKDERADFFGGSPEMTEEGYVFGVTDRKKREKRDVCVSVHGLCNAENALASYSVCSLLGANGHALFNGILCTRVEGRGEELETLDGKVRVITDYAHNEMSFRALFEEIRARYGKDIGITAVFGCPGEKAYERRRQLPKVACEYADRIIICEDDSGKEPFEDIKNDILSSVKDKTSVSVIKDRGKAIRSALTSAFENGETRVIAFAGKGGETKMRTENGDEDCVSDCELASAAVAEYNERSGIEKLFSSISSQKGRIVAVIAENGSDIAESLAFSADLLLKNGAPCLTVCSETAASELEQVCFGSGIVCERTSGSPNASEIMSICRRGALALTALDGDLENVVKKGTEIAISLNADKLVYLLRQKGILLNGRVSIPKLSVSSAELITLNSEYAYLPEMIRARRNGVKTCAAVDGRKRNELAFFLSDAPFDGTRLS